MKELNDSIVVLANIYMQAKKLGLDELAKDTYVILMELYTEQSRSYRINKIHLKAYV
jgi:hypothetical protein